MKTRLLPLLFLLLATMALLAFGVFTNVLTDLLGTDIKAFFRNNPWLIALFALFLGVIWYLYTKIENRSEKTAPEEVDKDQYEEAFIQFRKNLLEQYQTRLNSKTGRRLPINLAAKSTHFGMAPERVEAYFKDKELTIESEDIASEIDKILKEFDRLLLIGDPGAGKTTILLFAAINILREGQSVENVAHLRGVPHFSPKLPLILNLATWSEGRDFAEWYAQNIAHSYSLSPLFVRELLRRNTVVPFFDGFDEVAEQYRDDCFQKMAAYFGDEKRKQLIVSSRKAAYAAAEADAPVYAEIEVLPLSLAQIKKALSENAQSQAADRALLYALDHDKWLAEAVETPFYLNTASFLFGKGQRTLTDFPFEADNTKGRQAELVEIFMAEQVPEERDRKYLHFLAEKMEQESFLVFELVRMQPGWGKSVWVYRLVFGLIAGLSFTLPIGVLVSFIRPDLHLNVSVSFIAFLFCFANLMFFMGAFPDIDTDDIHIWSKRTFIENWDTIWPLGLVVGLCLGLCSGIVYALFIGSVGAWVGGLTCGLMTGLVTYLRYGGMKFNYLIHLLHPYQRFWATLRNKLLMFPDFAVSFILGVLVAYLFDKEPFLEMIRDSQIEKENLWALYLSIFIILIFQTLFTFVLTHHFTLRLVLYLEHKMPLRVVTFMDRMSQQHIFEDNRRTNKKGKKMRGATWRFRHKILQDYFAKLQ